MLSESCKAKNKVEAVKKTITLTQNTTNKKFEDITKSVKKQGESIRKLTEAAHQDSNNEELSLKITKITDRLDTAGSEKQERSTEEPNKKKEDHDEIEARLKELRDVQARKVNIIIHVIKKSDSVDAEEGQKDDLVYVMNIGHRQMTIKSVDESMIIKSFRLVRKDAANKKSRQDLIV